WWVNAEPMWPRGPVTSTLALVIRVAVQNRLGPREPFLERIARRPAEPRAQPRGREPDVVDLDALALVGPRHVRHAPASERPDDLAPDVDDGEVLVVGGEVHVAHERGLQGGPVE